MEDIAGPVERIAGWAEQTVDWATNLAGWAGRIVDWVTNSAGMETQVVGRGILQFPGHLDVKQSIVDSEDWVTCLSARAKNQAMVLNDLLG